ncbi:hypothetical protein BDN72DRAFT_382425 [Pluteus cervinus]|uniref:Uncharacterized protein n=1 Tax=Pluteus cervinus TaxID=181527 RepID=A0ACD3AAL2_9AGAR|nr:hypothetical protein BDN72DRAFT_382425 [Pluteus cervinus]
MNLIQKDSCRRLSKFSSWFGGYRSGSIVINICVRYMLGTRVYNYVYRDISTSESAPQPDFLAISLSNPCGHPERRDHRIHMVIKVIRSTRSFISFLLLHGMRSKPLMYILCIGHPSCHMSQR